MSELAAYQIHDDLQHAHRMAIEVVVDFIDGTRGWCFFMTPEALTACGDWVPGTTVRMHPGVPHMIVLDEISEALIDQALRHLDACGTLRQHTLDLQV